MVIPTVAGAFLLFWVGRIAGRRARTPGQVRAVSAVAAVVALPGILFALYYVHLYDDVPWFYSFRSLPGTELSACGLGFLAGVTHARLRPDSGGKIGVPVVLALLVLVPFIKPILSPVEFRRPRAQPGDGTVLQSTMATCGPASAATLLNVLGHPASERELAAESFTSISGTENWYLARALRRRGFDVTFEHQPAKTITIRSPSIAGVVLPGGKGHFIAILNSTGSEVTFVDPIDGRHTAGQSELLSRYRFTGFFMVVRPVTRRGE